METRMMKSEPEHADSETLNLDENHNPYELPEEEDDEEEGEEDSEEEKPAPKKTRKKKPETSISSPASSGDESGDCWNPCPRGKTVIDKESKKHKQAGFAWALGPVLVDIAPGRSTHTPKSNLPNVSNASLFRSILLTCAVFIQPWTRRTMYRVCMPGTSLISLISTPLRRAFYRGPMTHWLSTTPHKQASATHARSASFRHGCPFGSICCCTHAGGGAVVGQASLLSLWMACREVALGSTCPRIASKRFLRVSVGPEPSEEDPLCRFVSSSIRLSRRCAHLLTQDNRLCLTFAGGRPCHAWHPAWCSMPSMVFPRRERSQRRSRNGRRTSVYRFPCFQCSGSM